MALVKLYYRICNVCGTPAGQPVETAAASLRDAKRAGWTRQAECDTCPPCRRKGWCASSKWDDGLISRLRKISPPVSGTSPEVTHP